MAGQGIGYVCVSTFEQTQHQLETMLAFVREGDTVVVHSKAQVARELGARRETVYQYLRDSA